MVKVLKDHANTDAYNKDMVDRFYGPGVVLIGEEIVAEWLKSSDSFEIYPAKIDNMKLGLSGEDIQKAWKAEMGK